MPICTAQTSLFGDRFQPNLHESSQNHPERLDSKLYLAKIVWFFICENETTSNINKMLSNPKS